MSPRTLDSNKNAILQVFIFKDGQFWGSDCFVQKKIIVGRSPDADLELEEHVISRNHAELIIEDDLIRVRDLDSANGTYVNGEIVSNGQIGSLDELSIGSFTLKFKLLGKKNDKPDSVDHTTIIGRELKVDDAFTEVVSPEELIQGQLDSQKAKQPTRPPNTAQTVEVAAIKERKKKKDSSRPWLRSSGSGSSNVKVDLDVPRQLPKPNKPPTLVPKQIEAAPVKTAKPKKPKFASGTRRLFSKADSSPAKVEHEIISQPEIPSAAIDQTKPMIKASGKSKLSDQLFGADDSQDMLDFAVDGGFGIENEPEESEEEEYQEDFVEPFSLLNNLIRENFAKPQIVVEEKSVVEIIGYNQDKCVLGYDQISLGKRYRVRTQKKELVNYKRSGICNIFITDEMSGGIISGGRTIRVDDVKTAENQLTKRRVNFYRYQLNHGDYANLTYGGGGYFVRFINPPKLPKPSRNWSVDPFALKIFGSVFLIHCLFVVVLGLFSNKVVAANQDIDRFAKISIKDLELEAQEEEPEIPLDQLPEPEPLPVEEEPKEVKKEEPPKPKKEPKKTPPKRKRKRVKRTRKSASKNQGGGDGGDGGGGGGGVGMMAALGNLSQRKSPQNIVAAVSNIDAVRSPSGRSRYKLSGVVTKLPTSNVVVSRGRGVGVKAGIDLLRGGKGRGGRAGLGPGSIAGGKAGKRGVGGVVFKAPKRRIRVRGHLSREAVAQVVKRHLNEIQYCYEKNLLLNPELAGKLMMEWTITTSGTVSVVKTKQSSMKSPAVAMCIAGKIKGWKFPKPKGGIVVVTYPFIFNSIGF